MIQNKAIQLCFLRWCLQTTCCSTLVNNFGCGFWNELFLPHWAKHPVQNDCSVIKKLSVCNFFDWLCYPVTDSFTLKSQLHNIGSIAVTAVWNIWSKKQHLGDTSQVRRLQLENRDCVYRNSRSLNTLGETWVIHALVFNPVKRAVPRVSNIKSRMSQERQVQTDHCDSN